MRLQSRDISKNSEGHSNDWRAFCSCTDSEGDLWELRGYGSNPGEAANDAFKKFLAPEDTWEDSGYIIPTPDPKEEALKLFKGEEKARQDIFEYFNVNHSIECELCLYLSDKWYVYNSDNVFWDDEEKDIDSEYPEESFVFESEIISDQVYKGKDFTLIITRDDCGGSNRALIFDNSKQFVLRLNDDS